MVNEECVERAYTSTYTYKYARSRMKEIVSIVWYLAFDLSSQNQDDMYRVEASVHFHFHFILTAHKNVHFVTAQMLSFGFGLFQLTR